MLMAISASGAKLHPRKGKGEEELKKKKSKKTKAKDSNDTEFMQPSHPAMKTRPQSSPVKGRKPVAQQADTEASSSMNKLPPLNASPTQKPKASSSSSSSPVPPRKQLTKIPDPLTILQQAEILLQMQPLDNDSCGKVVIRFNHYHKEFPIYNGVLKWADVDHEYALSFVYQGNYSREMELIPSAALIGNSFNIRAFIARQLNYYQNDNEPPGAPVFAPHDENHIYFVNMKHHQQYVLHVEVHPEAGIAKNDLRVHLKPLKADELSASCDCVKPNRAFQDITQELRSMDPTKLSSDQAKEMLERRDLEDILYSGV